MFCLGQFLQAAFGEIGSRNLVKEVLATNPLGVEATQDCFLQNSTGDPMLAKEVPVGWVKGKL